MNHREEAAALTAALRSRLETTLRGLGLQERPVALLDWPHHTNCGDSAIWVGEVHLLRRLGARIVYRCSLIDLSPARLREVLPPDGVVLLSGGGSFGDVYPDIQRFRERVLTALPDRRVVQLPQSLHFSSPAAVESAKQMVGRHPAFTLLVRDDDSLALARSALACEVQLCPDAAFGADPVRPRTPEVARLWLMRDDVERAEGTDFHDPGGRRTDWPGTEVPGRRTWRGDLARMGLQVLARRERLPFGEALTAAFDPLARRRFARGLDMIGQGEVVITDRLHGHILSTLLGRPHVLLDNRIGKIGKFHRTWTSQAGFVRLARDPAHALALAQGLAGD